MLAAVAGTATTFTSLLSSPAAVAAANGSWGNFRNGEIPLSALKYVSNGYYLKPDAADAMIALRAEFQSARNKALVVNDGYRDLAEQRRLWNQYQAGGNLAAPPGTSNHGWGLAVDLGGQVYSGPGTEDHRWMRDNAGRFGWWWAGATFSQVEPWHWEFNGKWTGGQDLQDDERTALFDIQNKLTEIRNALMNGRSEYYGGKYSAFDVLLSHATQAKDGINQVKPLAQETKDRVRGSDPNKDMLQAILAKVNSLS